MRTDDRDRFAALHQAHARRLLAYALRRTATPEDAADVVAETFLVAWRRLDHVPAGDDALFWLYGVARRTVANQQRADRRRTRLNERLRVELPEALAELERPPDHRVLNALAMLDPNDREVLLLAGWEELDAVSIGKVLAISSVAARSRLHRARKRMRAALTDDPSDIVRPLTLEEVR